MSFISFREYVRIFVSRCRSRGIQLANPIEFNFFANASEADANAAFDRAQKNKIKFLHFVTSGNLKFHGN